jgi:predicted nucleotidyltransferase component of viral defense system
MPEISSLQKRVLDLFAQSSLKKKFYWTGGTLLAFLYLHHRRSNDLDFFSDQPFTYNQIIGFIRSLKKKLKLPQIDEKKIFDRQEFLLYDKQKLRLEFVYYPHPRVKKRRLWKGIWVDSLPDIAANKLMSYFDRNDPKDLFDLYFLLKKGYKVEKLIKLTEKKFGIKFNKGAVFSEAYKSLKDLNELKPLILAKNSRQKQKIIKEIQEYFTNQANKYLRQVLK